MVSRFAGPGNPDGLGVEFFIDKHVMVATNYVEWSIVDTTFQGCVPLASAGSVLVMLRKVRRFQAVSVRVVQRREWVEACPWCGCRPRLVEWDCDGPYFTADCGSRQCGGPHGSRHWD